MKEKSHMGLRVFLFIAFGILLLPSVNAQDPPDSQEEPCLFYAYSFSQNHYFLIQNDAILYGNNLTLIHNCEYVRIYKNNEFVIESNNSINMVIEPGIQNFTIETNEYTRTYQVEIIPDRLEWERQYEQLFIEPQDEFISINLSNDRENIASIFSIIIVWVLTTYVYWKLIESYVNKNFIEEVVK
jgi:hypothetical protein